MAAKDPFIEEFRRLAGPDATLHFDQFMELALYHPGLGYYARSAHRAGRDGDFLTSPETTPLFAACCARWLTHAWEEMGSPRFDLVEVGAGRGTLARAIIDQLPRTFRESLHIHLVERADAPRAVLNELGEQMEGSVEVSVHKELVELPHQIEAGAFIANELFDNLPVRRVMVADGWKEIVVRLERGRLREALVDAPKELVAAAEDQGLLLAEGQSGEISLGSVPLLESLLGRMERGAFLIFDYGGEAEEVGGDAAPHGTLAAHRGHSRHTDLLTAPGEQDITADVNFTPLRETAQRLGFATTLTTQSRFLLGQGLAEMFVARIKAEPDEFKRLRLTQMSKQLYHPEGMGEAFRVLHGIRHQ